MTDGFGAVSLVLHAHLPLVRHPENPYHLEELWFFEAMADCYLPILAMLDRLDQDQIPGRLTLSLSPTLMAMMDDELLRGRFEVYLERRIQLCHSEFERTREQPTFHRLAGWYLGLFEDILEDFQQTHQRDIASALAERHRSGRLELITCAGTHAILPLLQREETRRIHIDLAVDRFAERLGFYPAGLWLPECAYEPGLEKFLANRGIRYTVLEKHALGPETSQNKQPGHHPVACAEGLAFFTRDPAASLQVWSAAVGYPGDPDYREFYRDIGFELDLEYLRPFIHPDGIRTSTGLKYYRITRSDEPKLPYEPDSALHKVQEHAAHFVHSRVRQLEQPHQTTSLPPLILCAYDAELFGHWWFEGPLFLEQVFRVAAQQGLRMATPADYLDGNPILPLALPNASTWGYNGYLEAWLNPDRNAWLYRYLHHAEDRLHQTVRQQAGRWPTQVEKALAQATRELLLAQSSDWSFILNTGTAVEYSVQRIQDHLDAVHRLLDMVVEGHVDPEYLQSRQERWGIFTDLEVTAWMTVEP